MESQSSPPPDAADPTAEPSQPPTGTAVEMDVTGSAATATAAAGTGVGAPIGSGADAPIMPPPKDVASAGAAIPAVESSSRESMEVASAPLTDAPVDRTAPAIGPTAATPPPGSEPEPMEVDIAAKASAGAGAAVNTAATSTSAATVPPPSEPASTSVSATSAPVSTSDAAPVPSVAMPPPSPAVAAVPVPTNTAFAATAAVQDTPVAVPAAPAADAPVEQAVVQEAEAANIRPNDDEEQKRKAIEEAQLAAATAAVAQAAREEEEEKRKAEELERAKAQAEAEAAAAAKEEMARLQAEAAKQQAAAAAAIQAATSALLSTAQVATVRNLPGLSAAVNAALPTLTSATTSSSSKSSSGGASSSDAQITREGILASADKGYLPSIGSIGKEATKAVNDNPPYVHLSGRDTAPQLRIDENPSAGRRLTLRGGMRGYRMSRATHGVSSGTYYYEVMILTPAGAREVVRNLPDVVRLGDGLRENLQDNLVREVLEKEGADGENASSADATTATAAGKLSNKRARKSNVGTPPNYDASKLTGHVRIGWSMRTGDLQAPVGYDQWSYGFRDILGSRIHRSRREDRWGGEPFGPGDIMGLCITMIDEEEDGDASSSSAKGSGSHIRLFKNGQALGHFEIVRGAKMGGEAFTNIMPGTYYPAISSYMGGSARVNFGPHFVYPPPKTLPGGWKALPVSDLCPPPPEPKDAAALAVQERNFPKKTEDSVIKAFQEAVEIEAKIRSKCYQAHYSKHVEEVRSDRLLRGLNTLDLPADESEEGKEEEVQTKEDAKMLDVGA